MKRQCEKPAYAVVSLLGGCRAVADMVDLSPSAISRWCTPTHLGGTGGRIPQKHWARLMGQASKRGVRLDVAQLAGFHAQGDDVSARQ